MSGLSKLGLTSAVLLFIGSGAVFASEEAKALSAINAARVQAGCAALEVNPKLQAAAKGHAKAMAEKNFFSHTGKNGSKLAGRAKAQGYRFTRLAENIAMGQATAAKVTETWLGSPDHRRNALNCALKETGIAMVYQADDAPLEGMKYPMKYYWVQVFGTR